MTLRGLARGSALYSIGFVLPRIGSFLLLPIYVTVLSAEEFGAVALVVSVAQLSANLFRMGMDGALMRMHFDAADPAGQRRLIATVATLTGLVAAIGSVVTALLALALFETLFAGLPFLPFGAMAAALSFTVTFQYLPATVFRAREQPTRFLAFTGGAFVVTAAVTLVLLVVVRVGVLGALLGQLAGGLFVIAVSVAMLARAGGPMIDGRLAREGLRFGLPLVPHALSGWLLNVSDRWMLSFLLPISAAAARSAIGVYSLGYQLAYAIDLLAQSFNAAWVPFFYRYGSTSVGPRIHREMTTLVMAAFGTLAAALALNASLIVTVIAAPEFGAAADLIPILAVGFLAHVAYIALVTVIFHQRQTAVLPLITAASAGVNIVSNLALIPIIGVIGAAWATLAAFTFMAIATAAAARRVYRLELDARRLVALVGLAIAAAAFASLDTSAVTVVTAARNLALTVGVTAVAALLARGPAGSLRVLARSAAREGDLVSPRTAG